MVAQARVRHVATAQGQHRARPWLFEHNGGWNDYFENENQPMPARVPYTSEELQVSELLGREG